MAVMFIKMGLNLSVGVAAGAVCLLLWNGVSRLLPQKA